jgi:hypothetical protein
MRCHKRLRNFEIILPFRDREGEERSTQTGLVAQLLLIMPRKTSHVSYHATYQTKDVPEAGSLESELVNVSPRLNPFHPLFSSQSSICKNRSSLQGSRNCFLAP